jgi:hypothetical protein
VPKHFGAIRLFRYLYRHRQNIAYANLPNALLSASSWRPNAIDNSRFGMIEELLISQPNLYRSRRYLESGVASMNCCGTAAVAIA